MPGTVTVSGTPEATTALESSLARLNSVGHGPFVELGRGPLSHEFDTTLLLEREEPPRELVLEGVGIDRLPVQPARRDLNGELHARTRQAQVWYAPALQLGTALGLPTGAMGQACHLEHEVEVVEEGQVVPRPHLGGEVVADGEGENCDTDGTLDEDCRGDLICQRPVPD